MTSESCDWTCPGRVFRASDFNYTIGIDLDNEAGRRDGNALEIATLQGSKKRRFI
jgi:hypothetical protein